MTKTKILAVALSALISAGLWAQDFPGPRPKWQLIGGYQSVARPPVGSRPFGFQLEAYGQYVIAVFVPATNKIWIMRVRDTAVYGFDATQPPEQWQEVK